MTKIVTVSFTHEKAEEVLNEVRTKELKKKDFNMKWSNSAVSWRALVHYLNCLRKDEKLKKSSSDQSGASGSFLNLLKANGNYQMVTA